MDIGILGARTQVAQERIVAASERLGARFGLQDAVDAVKTANAREKLVKAMLQNEALAALLEALVDATATPAVSADTFSAVSDENTPADENTSAAESPSPEPVAAKAAPKRKGTKHE